ncbi:hypothetical protein [Pseudoalteromonas sp. Of7M-16]|uniref:hypothetical protein n=1 Tax=Pseudoalteromonas sp. Of7M-16 TaxID=2917756 RepID=UPI001EF56AA3|nr:hypothetical protein [Pseudoalteromonas sp. Of7M-16]MCG7550142.1 hypothetical protein [Pseudoalteromonas sp. Of7M-16]
MKKILLQLCLLLVISSNSSAKENSMIWYVGHMDGSGNKVPMLTSSHLNRLSNVTEFIISPTYSEKNISYASYRFNQGAYYSYGQYILDIENTLVTINNNNPNTKVWISTPPIIQKNCQVCLIDKLHYYPSKTSDVNAFLVDLKLAIENKLGTSFWENNVSGIYLYDEGLKAAHVNSKMTNYVKALARYVDTTYNQKKLMWAPYYNLENGSSQARIISSWLSTNAFDRIDIQPNVIFRSNIIHNSKATTCNSAIKLDEQFCEPDKTALSTIKSWVASQSVNGVRNPRVEIGVVMELENTFDSRVYSSLPKFDPGKTLEKTQRYYANYVKTFQQFVGNKNFTFYAGTASWLNFTPALSNCINDFYDGVNENGLSITWSDNQVFEAPACTRHYY